MSASACLRAATVGPSANLHALQHSRDEHAAKKLGVHSDGLERRPEAAPGNRSIGARGHAELADPETRQATTRRNSGVTRMSLSLMTSTSWSGCASHAVQAPDLRVGVWRLADQQKPRGIRGYSAWRSLTTAIGRIILDCAPRTASSYEAVVLLEESAEILFEPLIQPGQRLQNAERRRVHSKAAWPHAEYRRAATMTRMQ